VKPWQFCEANRTHSKSAQNERVSCVFGSVSAKRRKAEPDWH
jgi:hypothetical protein